MYKQPLSVYFVYHPNTQEYVTAAVEECYRSLQRNSEKPFSRFINIPVFYKTSLSEEILPSQINSKSEKTMIFLLIDNNVIIDKNWTNYYINLYNNSQFTTLPVAISGNTFNIKEFEKNNCIRAFEFEEGCFNECFLLSVTHEIYRWLLNDPDNPVTFECDKTLNIFISHTKENDSGCKIASYIQDFLTKNTTINKFIDKTDINPNEDFDEKIKYKIDCSTLLAISTDPYSSRYWCQKEILYAKEQNRPIVAIDCLQDYEDRRFPYASNIPIVHLPSEFISTKIPIKMLYKIVLALLLETLRCNYSVLLLEKYKNAGIIPEEAITLPRPPEFTDICKLIHSQDTINELNNKTLIYPEPLLYDTEISLFSNFGIKTYTPVSYNVSSNLNKIKVGISVSNIEEESLKEFGQFNNHIIQLSQDLARYLLAGNADLIYGGDLRKGGITNFLLEEARKLKEKLKNDSIHLCNYFAYPIHTSDKEKGIDLQAEYIKIANIINCDPPKDILDLILPNTNLLEPSIINNYIFSRCLMYMRENMIENCDFRIAAGGKHKGYKGILPGVLEEIIIAFELNKPIYLLGGFGGVTASICQMIKTSKPVEKLTLKWQIENNTNYNELLDYTKERKQKLYNYEDLTDILNWDILKNNGLSNKENERLFETPFVEEAVYLVMKGLSRCISKEAN